MRLTLPWQAARGRYLSVSLVTVVVSAGIVRNQWQDPAWLYLCTALAGAFLVHAGGNLWNDYADEVNGSDRANQSPSPFNGGSRVIQHGLCSANSMKLAALTCFGGAMILAVLLTIRCGWLVPALTLAGITLTLAYSSRPAWLCGRGLGELTVAFCFGPLLGEGTALVLTGRLSLPVLCAAIPLGLLVGAILTLNELPDVSADRMVGKRTLAVRRGGLGALVAYRIMIGGAFVIFVAAILLGGLPTKTAWALSITPAAAWICWRAGAVRSAPDQAFLHVAGSTILLHFVFGLLLVLQLA